MKLHFKFAFLLSLLLIPAYLSAEEKFSDVDTKSVNYTAIEYARKKGIVSGNPDGTFKPKNTINRAEFTKIVIESNYEDEVIEECDLESVAFSDISPSDWFAPYVCVAEEDSIIEGYPDGSFKPANEINFAEAAKIVIAVQQGELSGDPWYKPYVEELEDKSAIPVQIESFSALLTRGQMVEIVYRLLAKVTDKEFKTYGDLLTPVSPTLSMISTTSNTSEAVATFAGGCFWCMDPPYQEHEHVYDAIVGYAGGSKEDAVYSKVGRGKTEHREAVQVTYDPTMVTYEELLDIFWRQIDPTDEGGQFADRGFQYTTAIFYHDDMQKKLAEKSKADLEASNQFDKPIATEILPYTTFFPAEEYHQDYYRKSKDHYEQYKKGSGRAGFIEENWAKVAALEHADKQEEATRYVLSEEEITKRRQQLDDLSYKVIVKGGTEPPFENEYWDNKEKGIYVDKVSGEPLYASVHKFDSGTGWPSFWKAIDEMFITRQDDWKLFIKRTEVRSKFADSHLGHIFNDGPDEYGGIRHCINSAALRFVPMSKMEEEGYGLYLKLFE